MNLYVYEPFPGKHTDKPVPERVEVCRREPGKPEAIREEKESTLRHNQEKAACEDNGKLEEKRDVSVAYIGSSLPITNGPLLPFENGTSSSEALPNYPGTSTPTDGVYSTFVAPNVLCDRSFEKGNSMRLRSLSTEVLFRDKFEDVIEEDWPPRSAVQNDDALQVHIKDNISANCDRDGEKQLFCGCRPIMSWHTFS